MSQSRMKPFVLSLIVALLFLSDIQAQSYKQRDEFVGRLKAIRLELVYPDTEAALVCAKKDQAHSDYSRVSLIVGMLD